MNQLPRHSTKRYKKRDISKIKKLVLHCTDWDNVTPYSLAQYDISQGNHISATGMPAISYHYMIDKKGTIYKCLDDSEISWHAAYHNSNSLSVCMIYKPTDEKRIDRGVIEPSIQCCSSTLKMLAALCLKYKLTPDKIFGHRELQFTGWVMKNGSRKLMKTCPGLAINMDQIRFYVAKMMQQSMHAKNYYSGEIDGIFGPLSKAALKNYRRD